MPIISPDTIGVKLNVPVTVDPYDTSTFTLISGYVNVWYPVPVEPKLTNFSLSKLLEIVAPIPASASLNELSSTFIT